MHSRQLQYAVMLSKVRSFSQVAAELDISQPALSKQIITLENELGVKLFDRSTTPVSLTQAGEYFVQKAEEILFEEDVLFKTMEQYRQGEGGKLTIGVSPFRSLYLMPSLIKALKARFPRLQVSLCEQGRSQLHKGIQEGMFDFIITNLPVDEARLNVIPLEQDVLVLAVPNRLLPLLEDCPPGAAVIDFACCGKLPFAVLSKEQEMRQLFEQLCRLSRVRPEIYVEVVGVATAWAMVQEGDAVTLLPRQFVQADAARHDVTLFELDQSVFVRQPAIVTRRDQFISEYAQFAIETLTAGLR